MRRWKNRLLFALTAACALVSCGILLLIVGAVFGRGIVAINWNFFTEQIRLVGAAGGILFGILGLIIFVKFFGWGKSWLSGGILLGIMILPTVTISLIERIERLPGKYLEAAAGLGLTRSQMIWSVILPQSLSGLITGSLLGLARAAGETAPIMLTATIFAGATLPHGIKESPVLSLPYHIFILAQDSFDPVVGEKLWGTALVMVGLVFILSLIALPIRLKIHEEARPH